MIAYRDNNRRDARWAPQHNAHIIDYLSVKLHGGVSLTQAMSDFGKAVELAYSVRKPQSVIGPITN